MGLTSRLVAHVTATHTDTAPAADLGTPTAAAVNLSQKRDVSLASGTAAGQGDLLWSDQRTLSASASEDLDLAGVLADAFGSTVTFVRVKGLYVSAAAGNTNSVVVGAASSNAWATLLNAAGTVTLRPGGFFLAGTGVADATGWAVTAGTGDMLTVTNSSSGSSVTYDIVIIGASA